MIVRIGGAAVGAAVMVFAGAVAGGWWWLGAAAGAASSIGAITDRQLGLVQVVSLAGMAVGLVDSGHPWVVPLLAAGVFASIELAASADRATVVRPTISGLDRLGATVFAVAILVSGVLVVGDVSPPLASASVLVAAAAAVVATRVIAR